MEIIHGFKVFDENWQCRGKQYRCPGKFEEDVQPVPCQSGMHFCKRAVDCFGYYSFESVGHMAEVVAYGEVAEEDDKCCTNKLEIIREIPWSEVLEIVNTGSRNSGHYNSGNHNSGYCNSGNRNGGYCNSGHYNSGNRNGGYCNSGNYNSGDYNSGDYNSGDWNGGNHNSGDWNSGDYSNGCFNTEASPIYLFNHPSTWTYKDWLTSHARHILSTMPAERRLVWIALDDMTAGEMAAHPSAKTTGGYLKIANPEESRQTWWNDLSEKEQQTIMGIPNFDRTIFLKITGIDVDEKG